MLANAISSGSFVGRQQEIAELTLALDDAATGQGRVVVLAGEPGIGKTMTSQEFAAIAQQRGARVLWGRCYEGQGAPSYWPWIQIVTSYINETDIETLRSNLGREAEVIAEIVPELGQKLPGLKAPSRLDPQQARFRLFQSITSFLKSISFNQDGQPLVIVIE